MPYSLSGTTAGNLTNSTFYNSLGLMTEMNLGNGAKTTSGYWGVGGGYDTSGGYYGRLWELKTVKSGQTLMDLRHTWDAGGNLAERFDVNTSDNETFGYDFLDRLTSISGNYTDSYAYNEIGNITNMNGNSYTYGAKPHAVTQVGSTSYVYDSNGNMTDRGSQSIFWDVENRPTASLPGLSIYYYDGDGKRIKKTAGGQRIYVNKYFEKNLTTSENTTYYYLGGKMIAMRKGSTLSYIYQDHLGGTAAQDSGTVDTIKYYPYGATRSGDVPTDYKFTGQRRDGTGLYYYGARYYNPSIGRFISPDTIVSDPFNPQSFNRYSYCLNNPLRYTDPTGFAGEGLDAPTEDGQLGWTVADAWLISSGGKWVSITNKAADWVASARATQHMWSGRNWADLAILRSSGVEFYKAEVVTPNDLSGWPAPVSDINRDIYIIYLSKDNLDLHWKLFKPSMRTDTPFIYVSPRTSALDVQMGLPEELSHVSQELRYPTFKAKYVAQWLIQGGPLFNESGYWNNLHEVGAQAYARKINYWRSNPTSPLW